MDLLEKHLFVKESKLPNAGKGLFTKIEIAKGTRILEYKGKLQTWNEVKEDSDNAYLFVINSRAVINAAPFKKLLGRYANDAAGLLKVKGLTNNAEYVVEGKRCFIEAKKNIPANEEIFVAYGKEYWKVTKKNHEN